MGGIVDNDWIHLLLNPCFAVAIINKTPHLGPVHMNKMLSSAENVSNKLTKGRLFVK